MSLEGKLICYNLGVVGMRGVRFYVPSRWVPRLIQPRVQLILGVAGVWY